MLTYSQVDDFYPRRGDPRLLPLADLFSRATYEQVDALLVDDSQGTVGGSFGGGPAAAMMMLNQASGTKIPGTPWLPIKGRASTGSYAPASNLARAVSTIGTIDISKYPPNFAGTAGSPIPIDVNNAASGFGIVITGDSIRVEHNLDMLCQGQTDLITKDDTGWYAECIFAGCNNANIDGGTAASEGKIDWYRGNNEAMYFGSGAAASGSFASSGLALNTIGVDVPAWFAGGPIPFVSSNYIAATFRASGAGKARIAAARLYNRNQPGWFVHVASEGGYHVIDAGSMYTTHSGCGPFLRAMFSRSRNKRPDVTFFGLGTNDFFQGKTAAAFKTEFKTWLAWYYTQVGGVHPVVVLGEGFRGDTSSANYSTYLTQYQMQAGAIKEIIDEGEAQVFFYNGLLVESNYYGTLGESYLAGKTYLGDFSTLCAAAGSVAITQNVSYVSVRRNGHYQFWLYTGATTTIGAGGVISSERHGPGGDIDIGAPVSNSPLVSWQPIFLMFGRQGNLGPGAPNDFVHKCASGQQRDWELRTRVMLGACAATRFAPSRMTRN